MTAVYCFDVYVSNIRSKGWKICAQFHDEANLVILKTLQSQLRLDLLWAIAETNKQLNLNIELGISIEFGPNFAETH